MPLPKEPFSRKEEYLAKIANQAGVQKPAFPMSRLEQYLDYISEHSGSGEPEIVEISSFSGTFSDSDFEKVSKDNCIIVASTHYFYKQHSAATVIVYAAFPRLAGQSGDQSILFDTITIQKSTKEYELKSDKYPS